MSHRWVNMLASLILWSIKCIKQRKIIIAVYLFLVFFCRKKNHAWETEKNKLHPIISITLYPHEPYMYLMTNEHHAVIVYNNMDWDDYKEKFHYIFMMSSYKQEEETTSLINSSPLLTIIFLSFKATSFSTFSNFFASAARSPSFFSCESSR